MHNAPAPSRQQSVSDLKRVWIGGGSGDDGICMVRYNELANNTICKDVRLVRVYYCCVSSSTDDDGTTDTLTTMTANAVVLNQKSFILEGYERCDVKFETIGTNLSSLFQLC